MLLATVLLLLGAGLLAVGAEGAVRWAGRLAAALGIPLFVLGAALFGLDLEGLGAAIVASSRDAGPVAAGEALGTVLFVGSFAFGLALLVAPGPVPAPPRLLAAAPSMPIAGAGLALYDGVVTRAEGAVLVALFAGFLVIVVSEGRAVRERTRELAEGAEEPGPSGGLRSAGGALLSLLLLSAGAWALVQGAFRVLERSDLRAGFVGAALVATLAGLDEVLLAVLPVRRGRPDLATGNLFGTVAAFPTVVLGAAALVRPVATDTAANLAFAAGVAVYALTATVFAVRGRAGRVLGAILVAAFPAWLVATSGL